MTIKVDKKDLRKDKNPEFETHIDFKLLNKEQKELITKLLDVLQKSGQD